MPSPHTIHLGIIIVKYLLYQMLLQRTTLYWFKQNYNKNCALSSECHTVWLCALKYLTIWPANKGNNEKGKIPILLKNILEKLIVFSWSTNLYT